MPVSSGRIRSLRIAMSATAKTFRPDSLSEVGPVATGVKSRRIWWHGLAGGVAWSCAAALTHFCPDADDLGSTDMLATAMLGVAALLFAATVLRLALGR